MKPKEPLSEPLNNPQRNPEKKPEKTYERVVIAKYTFGAFCAPAAVVLFGSPTPRKTVLCLYRIFLKACGVVGWLGLGSGSDVSCKLRYSPGWWLG